MRNYMRHVAPGPSCILKVRPLGGSRPRNLALFAVMDVAISASQLRMLLVSGQSGVVAAVDAGLQGSLIVRVVEPIRLGGHCCVCIVVYSIDG